MLLQVWRRLTVSSGRRESTLGPLHIRKYKSYRVSRYSWLSCARDLDIYFKQIKGKNIYKLLIENEIFIKIKIKIIKITIVRGAKFLDKFAHCVLCADKLLS